jgi:hypothetical protein
VPGLCWNAPATDLLFAARKMIGFAVLDAGSTDMKKIIYDVGSNNGDDIPYYLMRAS